MISYKSFVIILLFMIIFIPDVYAPPVHCQCVQGISGTVSDCKTGSNCAIEMEPWVYSTSSCIIDINDCHCGSGSFCGGSIPCCFSGGRDLINDYFVDSCSDSYAICQSGYKCPDIGSYDGKTCEYVDDCCYGFGCMNSKCVRMAGKWDASQRRCVECNGTLQGKVIADNKGRYMDVRCYKDCEQDKWIYKAMNPSNYNCKKYKNSEDIWGCKGDTCCTYIDNILPWAWDCVPKDCQDDSLDESYAISTCKCQQGASRDENKCESACGADPRCDEFLPGEIGNCGYGSYCTSNCQCYGSISTSTTTTRPTTTIRMRGGGGGRILMMEMIFTSEFFITVVVTVIILLTIFGILKVFIKKGL